MSEKDKLYQCFDDTIWMAIRYAHGRNTYAPSMVRKAITDFQSVFPEWKPMADIVITPPKDLMGHELRSDYLDDLLAPNKTE